MEVSLYTGQTLRNGIGTFKILLGNSRKVLVELNIKLEIMDRSEVEAMADRMEAKE
jgi:hypothetical protein